MVLKYRSSTSTSTQYYNPADRRTNTVPFHRPCFGAEPLRRYTLSLCYFCSSLCLYCRWAVRVQTAAWTLILCPSAVARRRSIQTFMPVCGVAVPLFLGCIHEWCDVGVVVCLWSEVRMVCIWSSWCHTKTPSSPTWFKSKLVLPFWYWLTQVVLEKRPLNGCNSCYIIMLLLMILVSVD